MLLRLLPALALLLLDSCVGSGELPFADIEIVAFTRQPEVMQVFFDPPQEVGCDGIQLQGAGADQVVAFVRGGNPAGLAIHSRAVSQETGPFAGSLMVEVPIPPESRQAGGEFRLRFAGEAETQYTWKR